MIEDLTDILNDFAFNFGYGLFETVRIYNKLPFLIDKHVTRLINSASDLGFVTLYTEAQIKSEVISYIEKLNLENCALKIILTYGNDEKKLPTRLLFSNRPILYTSSDYESGFDVEFSPIKRNEFSPIVSHKTLNQLENILAFKLKSSKNIKEVVLFNTSGYLSEGTKSNIFFIKKGKIYTPSLQCGLLSGVTRDIVIKIIQEEKIPFIEGKYNINDFQKIEECFCTNSLMEIMPITRVNGTSIGTGKPGDIVKKIMNKYRYITLNSNF